MRRQFWQCYTPPRKVLNRRGSRTVTIKPPAKAGFIGAFERIACAAVWRVNHGKVKISVGKLRHALHTVHVVGVV